MISESAMEQLRQIPSVDQMLMMEPIQQALALYPRKIIVDSVRFVLESYRKQILKDPQSCSDPPSFSPSQLISAILDRAKLISDYQFRQVVNATGIIVHTNLGRSLVAQAAMDRLLLICRQYNNLEYDIEAGRRGSRYVHAESILCELTGAEAALVVNNNAAAVLLVLNTVALEREVVVSRGQLVEIGGSFRIPDVMRSSGAILREVGCTNRTHLYDYENAINERTALLLKVHTSNYRIVGFTSEVSGQDLAALALQYNIPMMEDLGSGCFIDLSPFGLSGEPTVQEVVRSGAHIITFSGDKLLGGPQAGIILGRKDIIERCKKNPLTRALRVDKMTLAVLEATLRLYRDQNQALESIPTLNMISVPLTVLEARAQQLARLIKRHDQEKLFDISVQKCSSQVGGGALPDRNLPSYAVALRSSQFSPNDIELLFRRNRPPIIGRIDSDLYLMDVRTLQNHDLGIIEEAFKGLTLARK